VPTTQSLSNRSPAGAIWRILCDQMSLNCRRTPQKGLAISCKRSGTIGNSGRLAVRADGFAWNGKTYPSLSQVAFAITGTRWNGPRFFGLRDKPEKGGSA
jgi:hypothetical protein